MYFKNKKGIESKNKLDFNSSKVESIRYKNKFSTLRVKMILLILSIIIPAISLLVYFIINIEKLYVTEIEKTVSAVLRSEVTSLEQIAEGSRYLLVSLSNDPMLTGADSIALSAHYSSILKQLPMHANIFAVKPNGDIFASATPLPEKTNVSDRLYFKEVVRTQAFSFGEYQIGRITKIPVIVSAYPVLDKNGNLLAVVGASLDLNKINLEMEKILPTNNLGTLIVTDNNGIILLLSPDVEKKWMGKIIPEDDIVMTILENGKDVRVIKGTDGIERIYSFDSIKSSNGKIFISYIISKKEAFNNININYYISLIWFSIILIIFAITLFFIRKLIKKTESQIKHLNNILESVHKVDVLLLHERNIKLIMDEVCKILLQTTGYVLVWIGSTEEKDKRVVPIARAGERSDYLDKIFITWDDSDFGLGPTGVAVKTRQVQSCHDIATAKYFKPWRKNALERGLASSVSLPIIYNEKIFGVITVYSDKIGFFDEHEIGLLEDISNNIAFTLHDIEIEIDNEQFKDNLKKNIASLNEAQHVSHIGSWDLNIQTNTLKWSDEIYRIFEIDQNKFNATYEAFLSFIHPDDRKEVDSTYKNSIKTKTPYTIEHRLLFSDGRIKYVHEKGKIYYDNSGNPTHSAGTIQDITERIKKEKELDIAKNEFISITSHQFRTPLSATKWVLETLFSDSTPTLKQKEKYNYLTISNERLIKLVNNMLSVSRIEAGKLTVNKEFIDIQDSVDVLKAAVKNISNKYNKKIIFNLDPKIKSIYCDPLAIHEILENLLSNAIEYSPENSEIIFNTAERKDDYLVSIHNDGYIKPESAEKIKNFSKFVRGIGASEVEPAGSGLGLYICKKLIEASGGTIWFESDSKMGTTFYITITKK